MYTRLMIQVDPKELAREAARKKAAAARAEEEKKQAAGMAKVRRLQIEISCR